MSKAGGTISQQAVVHPWLAADAHGNKQTNKTSYPRSVCQQLSCVWAVSQIFHQPVAQSHDKGSLNLTNINLWTEALTGILKNIHTQNLRTRYTKISLNKQLAFHKYSEIFCSF
jgi:hypothetical protein